MHFKDRQDAGRQLARQLMTYRDEHPIILAIPRGGVVTGSEVARALGAPLDVIVVRKLGAPWQPELGIGAIAPGGVQVLDRPTIEYLGISEGELEQVRQAQQMELQRRLHLYRGGRPLPQVRDRTVILVDDGLATGVTTRAAIQALRQQRPKRLILAVPVAAPETADRIRPEVDELVCLFMPSELRAIGLWYENFEQVSDEQVMALLDRARNAAATGAETQPLQPTT